MLDTDPHPFDEWFRVLAAEQRLATEQVRQLHEDGFIVTAGPVAPLDLSRLSTAIDGGDPQFGCAGPTALFSVDQRGVPRVNGVRCDVGAYEAGILFADGFELGDRSAWDS